MIEERLSSHLALLLLYDTIVVENIYTCICLIVPACALDDICIEILFNVL